MSYTKRSQFDFFYSYGKIMNTGGISMKKIRWEKMYEYAKKYYNHHGNLEVPHEFKTNNGYEYDKDGELDLGYWITKQMVLVNPNSEKGKKLIQIGMRFTNIQKHRKEMQSLCKHFGIDYIKNKEILSYISIHDFQKKINYLSSLEIPLIDREGRLHESFFMAPFDFENRYQKKKQLL